MTKYNFEKIPSGIFDKIKSNKEEFIEKFIDELEELFPEAVKDGKVDFQALLERFGEYDDRDERYELTWVGKNNAIREAYEDIVGRTLKYVEEESKNPGTTENLYIEGDNLEVLKLLKNSYYGKIKMIYIDPPYNTGSDFVYKDDFALSKEEYDKLKGDIDEYGERLVKNSADSGRYHSNWLNMMYPRLQAAKDLLTDDGAIFIHIDEHEIYSLGTICNEIFGPQNELGTIIWDKRNPKGVVSGVAYQHEYILGYCKNERVFSETRFSLKKENAEEMVKKVESLIREHKVVNDELRAKYRSWLNQRKSKFSGGELAYNKIDSNGKIYRHVSMAAPDKPETRSHRPLIHPVTGKPCPTPAKGWRNIDETMDRLLMNNEIDFGVDETTQPMRKYYLEDNMEEAVSSLIYYGGSDDCMGLPFDNPKPVYISKKIISSLCKGEDDIILDFFSGSATTAHGVMDLNAEDDGNRKFIMVQLPEPTDEKSDAYKAKFKMITDIGKKRIKESGDKILEDNKNKESIKNLDTGFKVFKVEDTNFKRIKDTVEDGIDMTEHKGISPRDAEDFNPHFTDLDIVYELILKKQDIKLTEEVKKLDKIGDRTYIVGDTLLVCLEDKITEEIVEKIGNIDTDLSWVVLRDSAFDDNCELKINTVNKLRTFIRESQEKEQRIYWI